MEAPAHADSNNALERFFKFKQWNTSLKRDTLAGLTTFIVMSYIIFVNPSILGLEGKGLPFAAALTSTCLVAGVMTIIMGLFTNRAYAIAPGMGLNAVVAFSLVLGQGLSFESAMGLIFLEGVATTILAIILNYAYDKTSFMEGTAVIPSKIFAAPDFSLVGAFDFGAFAKLGVTAAILWIFSLMLSDFFDTMGTLVGVGGQAGYLDDKGDLAQVNRPRLVDSLAAAAGGAVSASSATTYIESGAGVAQGGRTGWVAVIVGVLFLLAMFFSPIAAVVPASATAPALIIVGYLMMATLTKGESEAEHDTSECQASINFANVAFGLPAILIMTIM